VSNAVVRSAKRPDSHWFCMLCPAIIRSRQPSRPYGAGRAHNACLLRCKRAIAPVISPIIRSKRAYDTLKPSQQYNRRHQLNKLTAHNVTAFTDDSSGFAHIFAVLQHLVDTCQAFLNGDWSFINGVLGLMSPSATHPCPICIVSRHSLLRTARYRTPADRHSLHPQQPALLTIVPERIVPTPLHLFLGISNRIILDAFSELLGKENVENVLKNIKTVHSAGSGGLSDLHELNGPEISKWIKKECSKGVLAAATASSPVAAATTASHSILTCWLQQLYQCLLHSNSWTAADIDAWRSIVTDIHQHWQAETSSNPFPKLHMLHHAVDFAERYRFLGRASESQIESFHARFNLLFHKHHLNKGKNTAERLRSSLADTALRAVQPLVSP
jgi:hypothetical protein